MLDTENQNVDQDSVNPSVENDISQTQENEHGQDENQASDQAKSDSKEFNFKAMRESNARLQEQMEEQKIRADRLEKLIQERQMPLTKEEKDELEELGNDDWTTRAQAEKLAERKAKAIVKQMLDADKDERRKQNLPKEIEKSCPDFERVVTKENINYLKANKPHLFATLAANKDQFSQALSAYDAVLAFCPNSKVTDESARVERNASRPGTMGAAKGSSPLAEAKNLDKGTLTADLKERMRQEMIAATR